MAYLLDVGPAEDIKVLRLQLAGPRVEDLDDLRAVVGLRGGRRKGGRLAGLAQLFGRTSVLKQQRLTVVPIGTSKRPSIPASLLINRRRCNIDARAPIIEHVS